MAGLSSGVAGLAGEYLALLRRMEQSLTGAPARLTAVATRWTDCASGLGDTAESMRRGTDPARLGWLGLTADNFDTGVLATDYRLRAVATELAATAAPLQNLARKLGESRRNLTAIIDWYLQEVRRGRDLTRGLLGHLPPNTVQDVYHDYLHRVGRRATAWGRSVVDTYQYFADDAASRLRDATHLRLDSLQQLGQLTPYGQHYVTELAAGNLGVMATPKDLVVGGVYGGLTFPFELGRKIHSDGLALGSQYALLATPPGTLRNVGMLAAGHQIFEHPLLTNLQGVVANASVTYGSNTVSSWLLGPQSRTDAPGLLTINNALSSLMLLNRPGFLPQPELIDEHGRPVHLTNSSYNWNLSYDTVAIGGPTAVIFGAETLLTRRLPIKNAIASGEVLAMMDEVYYAGRATVESAGLQLGLAVGSTIFGGVIDPPPEPGWQRSAFQAVGDGAGWVYDGLAKPVSGVLRPVWESDPAQFGRGTMTIGSTLVAELTPGGEAGPYRNLTSGSGLISTEGRHTLTEEWDRVRTAGWGIMNSLGEGMRYWRYTP